MEDNAHVVLVKKLHALTNASRLPWESVVARAGEQYQVSIGDVTVRIREKSTHAGEPDYILSIIDGIGSTVDVISDVELKNDAGFDQAYPIMRELYRGAVRIATGADKILKNLIIDLDKIS